MSVVGSFPWRGCQVGTVLVSYSLKLHFIFILACLVGRGTLVVQVLEFGYCPLPSTGSPAWLQEEVTLGSIYPAARSLRSGPSIVPGVHLVPETSSPFPSVSHYSHLYLTPTLQIPDPTLVPLSIPSPIQFPL